MKIVSFEIDGLLGRDEPIKYNLSDDLAILTGRNGAGKTSVLKLLWSVISGNILIGLLEVPFRTVTVVTDEYECKVYRLSKKKIGVRVAIRGSTVTVMAESFVKWAAAQYFMQ